MPSYSLLSSCIGVRIGALHGSICGSERYLSAQIGRGHAQVRNSSIQIQNGTDEKQFGAEEVDLARIVDVRVAGSTVLGSTEQLFLP
jgi:hypothetical protein